MEVPAVEDALALVKAHVDARVTAVTATSLAGEGGYSGTLTLLTCTGVPDGAPDRALVMKTHGAATERARSLGLAREALFYANPSLAGAVACAPRVYFAAGNMDTGKKAVLLERVDGTQAGYFFGAGSPHNWRPDLAELAAREGAPTANEVTAVAFAAAAAVHARFWRDDHLRSLSWLRGVEWRSGAGEAAWTEAQNVAAQAWARARAPGGCAVDWEPRLTALVDASLARVSWPAFAAEAASTPWTLVHGDFHPANMMYTRGGRIVLLDWEVVGLGDPAQELGQFVVSHMAPADRRVGERERVQAYHAALVAANPSIAAEYTEADAWNGYVRGGAARWVWLLCLLADMCPPKIAQFFADQVLAFVDDHGLTAATVPMPRV